MQPGVSTFPCPQGHGSVVSETGGNGKGGAGASGVPMGLMEEENRNQYGIHYFIETTIPVECFES